ncbi:helix-turn-helix domain-containing protein [Staphylococcus hyicus]|uniref:helix-turn-helix domain-containing protein n=1 Tax=Staphylococcus hyicus TaxID=1284 RepID=UPI00211B8AF9|nr:helix-turn-helix domain-containing protein [Staphylococcus hyicus]MCQ9290691.1 helix-turn-helix domain-containing protein [Staphylococcus hyicus]MCQ9305933.1 helix-turn-helix domain-containing protein [Staphylococcus hyicus]MCQ9308345.1 helix-turn-helix domain-containing protein [Staphylococcus hyicus]MCQ9310767.1 helix-turn-helix domain-containing protein [Staphylococcus hyicus]
MAKRPSIDDWLKPEQLIRVQGWARDGLTMDQIAYNMGITKPTLYKWQKKNNNLVNALKVGRDSADRQVENALFKNAIGFHYTEEQITDDGEVVEVKKYSKPNTTAQIFWLKNRKPDAWREKQNVEHEGTVNQNMNISKLSDDELRKLANIGGGNND